MKRKLTLILVAILSATFLSSCQATTRQLGGDLVVDLQPGEKLEEITWKENSLWYLTRPMKEGEEPETHTFKESSNLGILEGTVTIVEHASE